MALKSNHRGLVRRLKVGEIVLITVISCCIGVVFNFFWVNRIPFVTPSKAELYAEKNIPSLTLKDTKEMYDLGVIF
ncbi:MAG: hypothetical protein KJO26_05405, partial [Deltaproteobacteria bacterium]|nr:hypothetical protein [Deltaproteobacteria bacterium]